MQKRLSLVACFVVVGFIIHTVGGCVRDPQTPSFDNWLAKTRYHVEQRSTEAQELWPDLYQLFPDSIQVDERSFQLVRLLGPASHSIQLPDRQFGNCKGWYQDAQGKVLQLSISDYAADTTGFFRLCANRWRAESQGLTQLVNSPLVLETRTWLKSTAHATQLEAIVGYRYHLVIRYNRQVDQQACEALLASLPWDRIPPTFR